MLLPGHLEEWVKGSRVNEAITRLNCWSEEDVREIDRHLNRNTDRRWKHTFDAPGWFVKGINPITGEECWEGCQFKPDRPRLTSDGKPIKYESISGERVAPLFLATPDRDYWQNVRDSLTPIVITEGAKKAGCGLSCGFPTVSLPGVWNGQHQGRLHHFLRHFCQPGRRFYLAFDSDVMTKEGVQKALIRLSRLLLEQNCNVSIVLFPQEETGKTGLDDFVADGGSLSQAIGEAQTFEEWNNGLIDSDPQMSKRQRQIAAMEKIYANRVRLLVRGNVLLVDGAPYNPNFDHLRIQKKFGIDANKDFFYECLQWFGYENQYDPVKDYLLDCYDRYGNQGAELLRSLSTTYLGTTEPLYDVYLMKTLLGAVSRVFEPGCKFETATVLQGSQGIGKSSFWRILAGEFFDDTMRDTSNDEIMKLHCCWFQEWGEIERVTSRKEAAEIKQFLSVQNDKFRPPYGRAVVDNPRRFVIVGSANTVEFLQDSTGDRRFWVIPVLGKIDLEALRQNRDKILAAAYALYRSGTEKLYLSPEQERGREELNTPFRNDDPWEELVGSFVRDLSEVKMTDLLQQCLGFSPDRIDRRVQVRVATILRDLGWEKVHTRTGKAWKLKKYGSQGSQTPETKTESGLHCDPNTIKQESQEGHNIVKGHDFLLPCDPVTHVTRIFPEKEKNIFNPGDTVVLVRVNDWPTALGRYRPPDSELVGYWRVVYRGPEKVTLKRKSEDGRVWTIRLPPSFLRAVEVKNA